MERYNTVEKKQSSKLFLANNGNTLLEVLRFVRAIALELKRIHSTNRILMGIELDNLDVVVIDEMNIKIRISKSSVHLPISKIDACDCSFDDYNYAAPELMNSRYWEINESSDIFSLGVILFLCLFGRLPSREEKELNKPLDISGILIENKSLNNKINIMLQKIIKKTLVSSSYCRVRNCDMFLEMLEEVIEQLKCD